MGYTRQIDLCEQDIACSCDDTYVEDDGTMNVYWELWFDVDAYFGTDTYNTDSWVNFYTVYHRSNGHISSYYTIDMEDEECTVKWHLTKRETQFLRDKWEAELGCSLPEYYDETLRVLSLYN